ncbi:MAG: hypothetical protein V3R73_03940 [Sphingomonadales bacterium]
MSEFMHMWAEELRTREQMLEDHTATALLEPGETHRAEMECLKVELDAISRKVQLLEAGADRDWEATKAVLHTDLEALDKDIRSWIDKTS